MATRLRGEFISLNGQRYQVQINDSSYSGSIVDVTVDEKGFEVSYDGETDKVFSPLLGSSLSLSFFNDSVAIDSFRSDLLNAQQKRFSIRVLKVKSAEGGFSDRVVADGGTVESLSCVESAVNALGGATDFDELDSELYWTGYVVQDLIEEADESKPRKMTLKASDALSMFSTLDYEYSSSVEFSTDIKEMLIDFLTDSTTDDLFDSGETMLKTIVSSYSSEHVYSATTDVLAVTKFDLSSFISWTNDGERIYTKVTDVLRELCLTFGARFYFSEGSYRFEQIFERDNENFIEFLYDKTGTELSNGSTTADVAIDQVTKHRSGGAFRYLPAIKEVTLTHEKKSAANLIGRPITFYASSAEIGLGVIPSANNGRVIWDGIVTVSTTIGSSIPSTAVGVFEIGIRLVPSDGSAVRYWKNSQPLGTAGFGPGSWSTSADEFKFTGTGVVDEASSHVYKMSVSGQTAPLPTDGEIYVDIDFNGWYNPQIDATFLTGSNSYSWDMLLESFKYENDNEPSNVVSTTRKAINSSTGIGIDTELELGSTRISDGQGAPGALYAYNGTTYVPSTGWRLNDSGTYVDIGDMVCQQILGLQSNVVTRFEGKLINSDAAIHNRFVFDSVNWLPMRGTFVANFDEFDVEVFKISKVLTDITIETPVDTTDDPVMSVSGNSGVWVNIGSGTIAEMVVDIENNRIGYFGQTSTGGEVNGTLDVVGAAVFESFAVAQAGQAVSVVNVAMTAGNSTTLTSSHYLIIATFSGSDGTYTFNLPDHGELEGRVFKFNFTNASAGQNVTINANGSDTIDGAGSISITTSGVIEVVAGEDEWISFP